MNEIMNKYFESIETHRRLVWQVGNVLKINPYQLTIHDLSKYGEEEFAPYASFFHGNKNEESKLKFRVACQHHYRYNRHHWQNWVLDGEKNIVKDGIDPLVRFILPMDYKYIVEMVADWQAMEIQHWGRVDMSGYLNKKFDKMILHEATRENTIEALKGIGYSYGSVNGFIFHSYTALAVEINKILRKFLNVKEGEN